MSPIPISSHPRDPAKKLVLFHRDFRRFTGGHLKVWHYFNHVASAFTHEPRIAFSSQSKWDASNPWFGVPDYIIGWAPDEADILFLAGTDWQQLPEPQRFTFTHPIINLIQHPRHAQPKSELRGFLKNRAVRICVSAEVADAINATGEVNGPVFTIANGIDFDFVPQGKSWNQRPIKMLICGLKAEALARDVEAALANQNYETECLTEWQPREKFLVRLSEANVTIFLPRPSEGFYLPALEGMAAGTIVVCPDCVGNRGFCDDKVNCFRPPYDADKIVSAARGALRQSEGERAEMLENARATVREHSLEKERESFLRILERVDELWGGGR